MESRGSFMYRPPRSHSAGWSPGKVSCLYHEGTLPLWITFTFLRLLKSEGRGFDSLPLPISCVTWCGL